MQTQTKNKSAEMTNGMAKHLRPTFLNGLPHIWQHNCWSSIARQSKWYQKIATHVVDTSFSYVPFVLCNGDQIHFVIFSFAIKLECKTTFAGILFLLLLFFFSSNDKNKNHSTNTNQFHFDKQTNPKKKYVFAYTFCQRLPKYQVVA